jgi:hypothetical protein
MLEKTKRNHKYVNVMIPFFYLNVYLTIEH